MKTHSMIRIDRRLAAVVLVALTAGPSLGQTLLTTFGGFASGEQFGAVIDGAGDVNGDGVLDLIVGAPSWGPDYHGTPRGRTFVLSGSDSTVLYEYQAGCGSGGHCHSSGGGRAVAGIGDVNADGYDDFAYGERWYDTSADNNAGRVVMRSGLDGAVLWTQNGNSGNQMGFSVAAAGDVDMDTVPDVIVGAWLATPAGAESGRAAVYSGLDGTLIWSLLGSNPGDRFGVSVAGIGDTNFDGFDDVAVGAYWADNGVLVDAGCVEVFDGQTGASLYKLFGAAAGDLFGRFVSAAGDLDPDIFVAPGPEFIVRATGSVAQELRVYNGATSSLVGTVSAPIVDIGFGAGFAAVGDADDDGWSDLAVGAPTYDAGNGPDQGVVYLFSAADAFAEPNLTIEGLEPGGRFGSAVSGLGVGIAVGDDWNGDGTADMVLGASKAFGNRGELYNMSGTCLGPERYCDSLPNSVGPGAVIDSTGSLSMTANDFVLTAEGLPSVQPGIFYYGTESISLPFGNGRRCVGGTVQRFAPVYSDAGGSLQMSVDWTLPPQPTGQVGPYETWYFQFWYRDPAHFAMGAPATFNLTDALVLSMCP